MSIEVRWLSRQTQMDHRIREEAEFYHVPFEIQSLREYR